MVGNEIPQLEDDIFLTVFLPGLISMAYLTGMEYITGTTVGRRVLSLRVMGIDGEKPPYTACCSAMQASRFYL